MEEMCSDYHGIDPERWTIDPHPLSACAELIEMGSGPTPTFLQALLADPGSVDASLITELTLFTVDVVKRRQRLQLLTGVRSIQK